jgi:hypothetical protein
MNKSRFLWLPLLLCVTALAGCLSFLGPINPDHKILGQALNDTVLIVDEDYSDGDTWVPAGVYLPDSTFSRGVANYLGSQPISVKLMGLLSRKCMGGVSADLDAPYEKYRLFLYFCGGERVITYSIPKKLKFRIVSRAALEQAPATAK